MARSLNTTIVSCTLGPRTIRSTDFKDIQFYGDPDLYPSQTEVYLPLAKEIYNTAHVYAPNGTLVASRDKVHLTVSESKLLDLTPGKLDDNQIIRPYNLCLATCLDAQNGTILLQPSMNQHMSAVNVSSSTWQPVDWANAPLGLFSKTHNIRFSINPMITGNLFDDMIVDEQSTFIKRNEPSQ